MRNLLILFIAITFAGCHVKTKKEQELQDSLKALAARLDYKRLPVNEAYKFINIYYLPRLDTLEVGRKILIHPLKGINFAEAYQFYKSLLEGDSSVLGPGNAVTLYPPPPVKYDISQKWD